MPTWRLMFIVLVLSYIGGIISGIHIATSH